MTVLRETPRCPYCGKKIAKAIYRELPSHVVFVGDTFSHWEYKKHKCRKKPKNK